MKLCVFFACIAWAQDPNTFASSAAGVSMSKPLGWHFTAQQNAATAPLVVITRHEEPFDGLNPTVKINIRPLGEWNGSNPVEIVETLTAPLQQAFKDAATVDGPRETELSGLKAGYVRVNFTLQSAAGRAFRTSSELWVVPRGSDYFLIEIGRSQTAGEAEKRELRSIVNSIKIDR
jgi:hypothetical protein